MAAGTRIADHPSLKDHWLIQHVADVEGEKMVVAQATVAMSLGMAAGIKAGEAIMGEWLLGATPLPSLEPWLTGVRANIQAYLLIIKQNRELQAAALRALEEENDRS